MSKSTAVVLLSSGLDSTVNLYKAHVEMNVLRVVTFNYGQRAAHREIAQSEKLCLKLDLSHQVINLKWLGDVTRTSLVNEQQTVPQGTEVAIDDMSTSLNTAKAVWVPNRNGVFLNIAAAIAEGIGAQYVIPGFNIEEAATFPDNSAAYLAALDQAFSFSTASKIKTHCFTTDKNKIEIAEMARALNVPLNLIWPCYFGGESICRQCESCQRFLRAVGV